MKLSVSNFAALLPPLHPRERMREAINWSRPEITVDVSEFPQLARAWLADKQGTVQRQTLIGYAEKLNYFFEFIHVSGLNECSRQDFEQFAIWLQGRPKQSDPSAPLGWNTRNDALRRLRSFLKWAFVEGYLSRNFSDWVPAASGSQPVRPSPPLDAVARMMAVEEGPAYPLRAKAIVALLFGVGLRRIEVHRLDVRDVRMPIAGQAHLEAVGKSGKRRLAAFDDAVAFHLARYLETRNFPSDGPLFVSKYGSRLSTQGVWRDYKSLAVAADVFEQLNGTHDGRRSFITFWRRYQNGAHTDDLLRRQVGHSSMDMTNQYSLQDIDEVGKSFVSPLSGVT